jgi:hypothetical protein
VQDRGKRPLTGIVRRAVDVNVRYYEGLFSLATDYLRDLGRLLAPADSDRATARAATPARAAPVMALEALAGEQARGLFVLENTGAKRVSTRVQAAPVVDNTGAACPVHVHFEPESVALDPGQQATVLAVAHIDANMLAGVPYTTRITVPGLSEQGVNVVLRRRHDGATGKADKAAETPKTRPTTTNKAAARRTGKKTKKKKTRTRTRTRGGTGKTSP